MSESDSTLQDQQTLPPEPEYMRDSEGNIILNKDGTPRKKAGRPKGSKPKAYNLHSSTKAKFAVRRDINRRKKEIEKATKRLEEKKKKLKEKKEVVNKLDAAEGNTNRPAILEEGEIEEVLPPSVQEEVFENSRIVFRPNPGPQTDFLAAPELDVLYGGQAGGGKSYAMLADALRNVTFKEHRALILRKTLKELRELIDKSRELYPLAYPGAKYNTQDKIWRFPNGAIIEFGYLETDSHVFQYQGLQYSWIGFDEITHLPTEYPWNYLQSRLRTTNPQLNVYMRATANPGGPGHHWVKARYVDPAPPNTSFSIYEPTTKKSFTRKFIPARLSDNPYLNDGRYEMVLALLPEIERKRLLEGDWNIAEGMAFPEFNTNVHVIPPMAVPLHWERVKAVDYGYNSPSCCLWGAIDPEDGTLIIYSELYERGLEPSQLAKRMHEKEKEESSSYGGDPWNILNRDIRGVLDGACWNRTGHTGPTHGEVLVRAGHKLRPADKNRKGGKVQLHEYLRCNEQGRPKLQIFSSCVNLIRELQNLPLDKNDPEDVDTHAEDHAYDALRYLIMSRPRRESYTDRLTRYKSEIYLPADSRVGY